MERRAGIGRGRLGVAARAPPQLQPETREMQAQSIEQITQGLQNATVGGRYRPSARAPRPAQREEVSTDSGHHSGHASSDPPSPAHQSLQARVRAEVKTKEQKRMEDDLFDQGQHLQPAMKQKIEEGKFYGTSGTEVILSSNFYRVRKTTFCLKSFLLRKENFEPAGYYAVLRGLARDALRNQELCIPIDSGCNFESTGR